MSSYLDAILSGQSQRKATGGGALTPGQVEAAAQGDIAARYQAGAASRALNIAQQNADTQARAEAAQEEEYYAGLGERTSEFTTTSGFTQQGLDIQKQQETSKEIKFFPVYQIIYEFYRCYYQLLIELPHRL